MFLYRPQLLRAVVGPSPCNRTCMTCFLSRAGLSQAYSSLACNCVALHAQLFSLLSYQKWLWEFTSVWLHILVHSSSGEQGYELPSH